MNRKRERHSGRPHQTMIYLGKLFRMFIYQNDWKLLPMAAIIAGLVCFVVGQDLFRTMEGTRIGTFAMSCICIWNGFFNSIQVICRERPVVKREHRSGLHISSYIAAHMIYQAFLCLSQAIITVGICRMMKTPMPAASLFTPWPIVDLAITFFLTTYCADMMALMVSALVHSTTAAMTIMPFLLIIQLVFSGGIFQLTGPAERLTDLTVAKWGMTALCSQGDYNSLPMVSIWNSVVQMKNVEVAGEKPIQKALQYVEETGRRDEFLMHSAQNNQKPEYAFDRDIVLRCWEWLVFYSVLYAFIAVISLELIDRDRR